MHLPRMSWLMLVLQKMALRSRANHFAINSKVEMFNLESYGSEPAEKKELGHRLGTAWAEVQEIGKFYNQAGGDTWFVGTLITPFRFT
jgi:hypothetical protein